MRQGGEPEVRVGVVGVGFRKRTTDFHRSRLDRREGFQRRVGQEGTGGWDGT